MEDDDPLLFPESLKQHDPILRAEETNGLFRAFDRRQVSRDSRRKRFLRPDASVKSLWPAFVGGAVALLGILLLPPIAARFGVWTGALIAVAMFAAMAWFLRDLLDTGERLDEIPPGLKLLFLSGQTYARALEEVRLAAGAREWAEALYLEDRHENERGMRLLAAGIVVPLALGLMVLAYVRPLAVCIPLPFLIALLVRAWRRRHLWHMRMSAVQYVPGWKSGRVISKVVGKPVPSIPGPGFGTAAVLCFAGILAAVPRGAGHAWSTVAGGLLAGAAVVAWRRLGHDGAAQDRAASEAARAEIDNVTARLEGYIADPALSDPDAEVWHDWLTSEHRTPGAPCPAEDAAWLARPPGTA